jgi:Homeodomain
LIPHFVVFFSWVTRGKRTAYRHPLYLAAVAAAAAAASSSLPAAHCGTSRLVGGAPASPVPSRRQARKGGQVRFTHEQSSELEKTFASQRYLTPGQRTLLANKLALTERQVHRPSPGQHKLRDLLIFGLSKSNRISFSHRTQKNTPFRAN